LPSFLRGCEFFAVLVIPLDVSPIVRFVLITAIALWHYTNLYDALHSSMSTYMGAGLRMAGRISLCLLAFLLGFDLEISLLLSFYLLGLIIIRGGHNVAKGVA
jgi:hypothetical protein